MRAIRVTFSDGDHLETEINGTEAEIRAYYLGAVFNFGDTGHQGDRLVTGVAVDFLPEPVHHCADTAEDRSLKATCGANLSEAAMAYPVGSTIAACSPEEVTCPECRDTLKRSTQEDLSEHAFRAVLAFCQYAGVDYSTNAMSDHIKQLSSALQQLATEYA